MSASADNGGGDPSPTARDKNGELQKNTSRIRQGVSSASSSSTNNIGRPKRKIPTAIRSARPSRESSPARSAGPKTPQTQGQQQLPASSLAPHIDSHQRPSQPLPNTPRLAVSRTPPPDSRQPLPSPRKRSENPPPTPTFQLRREGSIHNEEPEDDLPGMRTPRSNSGTTLETVVESSLPGTPSVGTLRSLEDSVAALVHRQPSSSSLAGSRISEEVDDTTDSASTITRKRADSVSSSIAPTESESEAGYRSGDRTPTSSLYRVPPPARVFGRRPTVTGKEPSSKAMTVETETVSSVPQIGLGAVGPAGGASIRSKKSTDTIRASRREKKRAIKRAMAAGPSNPSSKVEIFAAKIAEAVDEAFSSDSDETFVYESNPPDAPHHTHQRPASRFHSRTPSATSIGPDLRGQRLPLMQSMEGTNTAGRKGMKFVNNSLKEPGLGGDGVPNDGTSSERAGAGSAREHQMHAERSVRHHNGHQSTLIDDNTFHRSPHRSAHSVRNAATSIMSSRGSSRPPSPRHPVFRNGAIAANGGTGGGRKSPRTRVYEADVENGDDEHTPLLQPNRTRPRRRQMNGSVRQMEHNARRRGCFRTYAGCIVAIIAIILILTGVGGFLVSTTNPLQGVRVLNVTDVLVSKQEIMLDLVVQAVNPNAIAVTVGNMDVNLFAKSSHVRDGDGGDDGDDEDHGGDHDGDHEPSHEGDWWEGSSVPGLKKKDTGTEHHLGRVTITLLSKKLYPPPRLHTQYHTSDNVDEGTDPPDDLPKDRETMLLGRIFSFDSGLVFEGSPLRRMPYISSGELRLARPGNKTEEGGTARWERVLMHPFELIVRGVLKYQLPLSGRIRTAPISGSVMIHPGLNTTPTTPSE